MLVFISVLLRRFLENALFNLSLQIQEKLAVLQTLIRRRHEFIQPFVTNVSDVLLVQVGTVLRKPQSHIVNLHADKLAFLLQSSNSIIECEQSLKFGHTTGNYLEILPESFLDVGEVESQ